MCFVAAVMDTLKILFMWIEKITEIQPGLEPGSSEFRSDALTTELLELWHWSRGYDVIIHRHDSMHEIQLGIELCLYVVLFFWCYYCCLVNIA